MKEDIVIVSLKDRPDLLVPCAQMAGAEWGGTTGYDVAAWVEELTELLARGCAVLVACGCHAHCRKDSIRQKLRRLFGRGAVHNPPPPPGGYAGQRPTRIHGAGATAPTPRAERCPQRGTVIGMVTVIPHETPPDLAGIGPWVSALLVAPAARHNGTGRQLLQAACDTAKADGANRLRALTEIPDWFAAQGWEQSGSAMARGLAVTVMSISL